MEYKTKLGDRPTQAHINYHCPCGCVAGLTYDRQDGSEHLGMCCCGRLLWVGSDATAVVRSHLQTDQEYELHEAVVTLPWGEERPAALAVPQQALANEQAKRDAGKIPTKLVDPVCRMMFDPETAATTSVYRGATYYFCAETCKIRFDANPRQFAPRRTLMDRLRRRG